MLRCQFSPFSNPQYKILPLIRSKRKLEKNDNGSFRLAFNHFTSTISINISFPYSLPYIAYNQVSSENLVLNQTISLNFSLFSSLVDIARKNYLILQLIPRQNVFIVSLVDCTRTPDKFTFSVALNMPDQPLKSNQFPRLKIIKYHKPLWPMFQRVLTDYTFCFPFLRWYII